MRSLLDQKRWVLKTPLPPTGWQPDNLPDVLARLLFERSGGEPRKLLEATALHDPDVMGGIEAAVERLHGALERDEPVFVHGDFDVDGITSTALLYLGLRELGLSRVKVEIEDRQRGHGLNDEVIRRVIDEGFSLLLTADCGISDVEPVRALNRAGVDAVVTDHHQPPETLPEALALVNPHLPDCPYPNKYLAGVGVAFQLLRALYRHRGRPASEAEAFSDLAALGTVADLVPLIRRGEGENRQLVCAGLDRLQRGEGNLGLRTLIAALGLDVERLSAGHLGFILAPHINAANRVGDPRVALLLLTTRDPEQARYLAEVLMDYNQDRKAAQEHLRNEVSRAIEDGRVDPERERLIWVEGERWNPGILGLVASDVVERYGLPAILISREGGLSRASARSVREFDMIACLQANAAHFLRFGGHRMAAGFTARTQDLAEARAGVLRRARGQLAELKGPVHEIDSAISPEEINLDLHADLQRLAPFGVGNPAPKFLLPRVRLEGVKAVGDGKHLKCQARINGHAFEAIGFSLGGYCELLTYFDEVGLVFKLGRNEWLGRTSVQLELTDVVEPSDF